MGTIYTNCFESKDKPEIDTQKLQQQIAKLEEEYESERNHKSRLIDKIQDSANTYDELISSQRLLNNEYEKEIIKYKSKSFGLEQSLNELSIPYDRASDEYKLNSPTHFEKYKQYEQQIDELNQHISSQNEENKTLKEKQFLLQNEINTLMQDTKSSNKSKQKRSSVTAPTINQQDLIVRLKKKISSLQLQLNEYENNDDNDDNDDKEYNLSEQRVKDTWTASTKVTDVSAFVVGKYKTAFIDIDCSDADMNNATDSCSYDSYDSSYDSSYDEQEIVEIEKRKTERDTLEAMQKALDALSETPFDNSNRNLMRNNSQHMKNLFRDTSDEGVWPNQELIKHKKEMQQQMISLLQINSSKTKLQSD